MKIDDLGPGEQTALFSQIAETTPHILWVFTADWSELVFVNERYEEIWGQSIEDLESDSRDFLNGIHPDDRADVQAAMGKITNGNEVEIEYRVNADEDFGRWVHVHGKPIRDDDGDIVRVAGFARDITEEKERKAELERKNERLESFASVVSHDLRNPLNVAAGNLELLRDECDSPRIDAIERAHDRMDDLIEHLLDLARNDRTVTREPVDLESLAADCWRDVATDNATLRVESPPTIAADVQHLKQLFENLYRNAVQHGGDGVTITVGSLPEDDGFYVEDDGSGIPPEHRKEVFEPGFSTRPNGSGLGLSIVSDVANAHGWTVEVTDGETGGARFEFRNVQLVD